MPILFALLLVSSGIVLININTKNKISNKKWRITSFFIW
jgi:hypothetical protein